MTGVDYYLNSLESQHQKAPKFMATVRALLEKVDDTDVLCRNMPRLFSLDEAAGSQLDVLGQIVGVDRRIIYGVSASETLDDETYRDVIRTKIVCNQWNGSYDDFRSIWRGAIPDNLTATIRDNQDMSVDINIVGDYTDLFLIAIQYGDYIPKPMGVKLNISARQRSSSGTADNVYPMTKVVSSFGEGLEARTLNYTAVEAIQEIPVEDDGDDITPPTIHRGARNTPADEEPRGF